MEDRKIDYFDNKVGSIVSSSARSERQMQQTELEIIYHSILKKDFDMDGWIKDFSAFSEKHERILYSILSGMILNEQDETRIANLELNLDKITSKIALANEANDGLVIVSEDAYKLYYKFFDHCSLAIAQSRIYKQTDEISKRRTEKLVEQEMQNAIDKKVLEYKKDTTTQLVGLVSIFTALSFVIFGGINVLGNLLENIRLAMVTRMVCAGLLWTICMSMLFYIFVRFILKIMKPDQEPVLSRDFMKSFWWMMGILSLLLIVFVVLSFFAPKLFAII